MCLKCYPKGGCERFSQAELASGVHVLLLITVWLLVKGVDLRKWEEKTARAAAYR